MNKPSFTYTPAQFFTLYLSWWTFWSLLQMFVIHRFNIEWEYALIDAFFSNFLLALACYSVIVIYRFYQPQQKNYFFRIIFAIVFAIIYGECLQWTLIFIFKQHAQYLQFLSVSMPLRFVFSLMMLSFVTVITWLMNTIQEKSSIKWKQSEAEQLMKEAELVKLRQQLQPHFLFNSLNSISALAGTQPQLARKMIQQLSDFLRGTLKKDEQEKVNLKDELDQLNLYLEIEKVRFGERLTVEIECSDEFMQKKLPPLLLQPIVENAIKFGLYGTTEAVTIHMKVELLDNNLCIQVSNPFDESTVKSGSGTGFGLSFIQRRLYLLYAQNNLLSTHIKENRFYTQIIIPQSA